MTIAGCADAERAGEQPENPTIVSLNPCTDAILAEIADSAQLLAVSHYSHDPRAASMPQAQARRFRATGGTVEEVAALAPEIVVASAFVPPGSIAALRRLGIRVETFGIASSVNQSEAQIRRLAALAGRPSRGERLIARIDNALAVSRHPGPQVRTLLWQAGGIVPGEQTLAAELLDHTGFASHSAARGLGQGAYLPLEQVLVDPPELVLAAGAERMLTHPVLRNLPTVRYARLDPSLLYCGGPSIIRLTERLAEIRATIPLPHAGETHQIPLPLAGGEPQIPLPLAGGARGGPVTTATPTDPPPTPPASGRGEASGKGEP